MNRSKPLLLSFLLVVTSVLLTAPDAMSEDVGERLRSDFSSHPALRAENFNIEIKSFDHGFLSLYLPDRFDSRGEGEQPPYTAKLKELMEKAETLALKYPEVRDVTWFVKGTDGGAVLYLKKKRYFVDWTMHFHPGYGKLGWIGNNDWKGGTYEDVWVSDFDFGKRSWPTLLHFRSTNTSTRFSIDGGNGDRYRMSDISFGFKKYFGNDGMIPYLGVGVTHIVIDLDLYDYAKDNGYVGGMMDAQVTSTNGIYINAGIVKKFGRYFEGGIDLNAMQAGKAIVELRENDMSNYTAGLFLGAGF